MAKFFLVLTIILAGAAAGIGYKTYQQIGDVKSTLKTTLANLNDTKQKLAKSQNDLQDTKGQLDAANKDIGEKKEEINTLTTDKAKLTTDLSAANAQVADLTDKLAKETALYNAVAGKTGPAPAGSAEEEFQKKLQAIQTQLDEANLNVKTLTTQANDAKAQLADLKEKIKEKEKMIAKPGVEGMVMAVNQGWSFVVISLGDRQGATPNAELLVKRGETLIGKLKITTVNPSTSIADILPDSISKGQRVLPGDRVIFTGPPTAGGNQ